VSCVSSGCLRFGDDVSAAYAPLYRDTRRWKRRQTGYSGFFNAFICDRIICETQCEANVAVESFLALARSCLNVCSIRYPAFAGLALCASLGIPRGRFQAPGRTHRFGGEIVRKCPRSVRTHQRRLGRGRRCERGTVSYQEPQVGIEPTTARLRIECSTTELLWHNCRWQMADGGWQQLPSAVCLLPSGVECPGSDSNRDALRHHPLKMACLPVSPPGQSQRVHLRILQQRSNTDPPATGATGFEPATSRVTVECSNQTELRPLHLCTLLPRAFAE